MNNASGDTQEGAAATGGTTGEALEFASRSKTSIFESFGDADARDLIAEYPLAWVCAGGGSGLASLLPLLAETDDAGRVIRLVGHMARENPLWSALKHNSAALILFQGPQAYVSPSIVGRRSWVPTWNFGQLRINADVRFRADAGDVALEMLVNAMEQGQTEPWRVEETGPRYRMMEQSIIAFDAEVTALRGRFKLGQDETPETVRAIIANHPDVALVRWMKRFNEGRF